MSVSSSEIERQAFPILSVPEVALLRPYGEQCSTHAGELLFEAGKGQPRLVVVLSGRVEVIDRSDGEDRYITGADPGGFVGEMGLLTGQTAYATCIVREPGEVLLVPAPNVQEAISTNPVVGNVLVAAFAARRQLLMRAAEATLTLIGPEASPGLLPLEEFVARNRIPYRWLEPDDQAAVALLGRVGAAGPANVWAVVRGQKALADPTPLYLAKALGLDLAIHQDAPADMLVVGSGPAGLAAAVYGASEGLQTIAIDDVAIGGQAGSSSLIENYLGFPTGISGGDLAFKAEVQALKFGARITMPRRATALRQSGDLFGVELDGYNTLLTRSVVIATGARYRRLEVPREEEFEGGAGIYYAATELEARMCRNSEVVIVGAGNSAGQAAMFLAETASRVHLIARGPDLQRSMSQYLISRLEHAPNVQIATNSQIATLHGDGHLEGVTVTDNAGEERVIGARALFVMIGADPHTEWLRGVVDLDERGFVLTGIVSDMDGSAILSPFQTSLAGIFAVGDVRSGSVKRVASAVGEGSVVVQAVHRYLASLNGPAQG